MARHCPKPSRRDRIGQPQALVVALRKDSLGLEPDRTANRLSGSFYSISRKENHGTASGTHSGFDQVRDEHAKRNLAFRELIGLVTLPRLRAVPKGRWRTQRKAGLWRGRAWAAMGLEWSVLMKN
jgi:hypothetical protein